MPRFIYPFRVSWVETDALSVVHFSNYFRYFEKAEQEFYRSVRTTQADAMEKYGIAFPRVEAHCSYLSPLRFDDEAETELALESMADKSVTIRFEIRNRTLGKKAAEGSMTLVCVDTGKWKAMSMPQEARDIFAKLG